MKVIKESCSRINKLEKSDNVYNKSSFEIFENETDAKILLNIKRSVLESATDKCKSVASILESISVKHS
jgi:uncharacterized protein Yka (UPF0111/DUF47 family)